MHQYQPDEEVGLYAPQAVGVDKRLTLSQPATFVAYYGDDFADVRCIGVDHSNNPVTWLQRMPLCDLYPKQ